MPIVPYLHDLVKSRYLSKPRRRNNVTAQFFQGPTEGYVIESLAHEHRGKLCTLLVKRGTLKKGNIVVAGTAWCKVRSLFDEWGKPMQQVEPGCAAQVTG